MSETYDYQGWTNAQTWCVANTFNNTKHLHDKALQCIRLGTDNYQRETFLKALALTYRGEVFNFATWAWPEAVSIETISQANWSELREHYETKIRELMNVYEAKKQARIERLRERAAKKREFASQNDLSLYGEEKSGIPLGQPILIGHHSEKRHRKHLERIENKVRKGFEAAEYADTLDERADAAESRRAIDSDNPEAARLITEKIAKITKWREELKASGKYQTWQLTNSGAEIRRLKKRLEGLAKVQAFAPFEILTAVDVESVTFNPYATVELKDGQIQVEFPFKPNEETRTALKRSPLALKWSSYSGRWVRKHTETTASNYFRQELIKVLKDAKP